METSLRFHRHKLASTVTAIGDLPMKTEIDRRSWRPGLAMGKFTFFGLTTGVKYLRLHRIGLGHPCDTLWVIQGLGV